MKTTDFPNNLLRDCGIECEQVPEDAIGMLHYLLYSREKSNMQRNTDIVMDYYQEGLSQSAIATRYGMTRQRVFDVLKSTIQYLSEPENQELLKRGLQMEKEYQADEIEH